MDAEDAVQQAALLAWSRRAQYDAQRPFKSWWFAILRNHCLDELRARGRTPTLVSSGDIEVSSAADESLLDRLALERSINQLPEGHREVLQLRYYADLSYQEIALILKIPQGTAMSRLHLARKALAKLITKEKP